MAEQKARDIFVPSSHIKRIFIALQVQSSYDNATAEKTDSWRMTELT